MERSEAYWILYNMWGKANEEQREALSIAQRDIEFVDLMDDRFLPVKHGRWKYTGCFLCECQNCGEIYSRYANEGKDWNYCPSCGAKMDGKSCVPREDGG